MDKETFHCGNTDCVTLSDRLIVCILKGFFGKETSHENKRAQEETARSANIGIKSQDIAITATGKSIINKDQGKTSVSLLS